MDKKSAIRRPFLLLLLIEFSVCKGFSNPYNLTRSNDRYTGAHDTADSATSSSLLYPTTLTDSSASFRDDSYSSSDTVSSESIVENRVASSSSEDEEDADSEDPEGPPDHVIPYSEHEEPNDVSTKPKYVAPGVWAKPPADRNVPLDFVPTKLYAQVRGKHSVKRLPKQEAIESAATEEERINAPRLREVVTNSKVNTVYTEEGYEDSAYDHAGHIRDADFHEGFARKLQEQVRDGHGDDKKDRRIADSRLEESKDYDDDYSDHLEEIGQKRSNKLGNRDGREEILESGLDAKFVAQNGIEKLEKDLARETEEAEKGSEIYLFRNSERENDADRVYEDSTDKPVVFGMKKRKKARLEQKSSAKRDRNDKSSELEHPKKKHRRIKPATTIIYDTTTLSYEEPELRETESNTARGEASSSANHETPTTVSYGQIFWDFFKTKDNEPVRTQSQESSVNTQYKNKLHENVSRGLSANREATILPTHFVESQNHQIDRLPATANEKQVHFANDGTSTGTDYIRAFNSAVSTFANLSPSEESHDGVFTGYPSLGFVQNGDAPSSVPASSTVSIQKNPTNESNFSYEDNPFLSKLAEQTSAEVAHRNKPRYKVLARHKPRKSGKSSKSSEESLESAGLKSPNGKLEEDSPTPKAKVSSKYEKMWNYLKSHRKPPISTDHSPYDKASLESFTIMRPPLLKPVNNIAYSNLPLDRSRDRFVIIDQPSASFERNHEQESNWQELPVNEKQHRSPFEGSFFNNQHTSASNRRPFSVNQSLHSSAPINQASHSALSANRNHPRPIFAISSPSLVDQSPILLNRSPVLPIRGPVLLDQSFDRNLSPATRLLPPSALSNSDYAKYGGGERSAAHYVSAKNDQRYNARSDHWPSKYVPIVLDWEGAAHAPRRKRSAIPVHGSRDTSPSRGSETNEAGRKDGNAETARDDAGISVRSDSRRVAKRASEPGRYAGKNGRDETRELPESFGGSDVSGSVSDAASPSEAKTHETGENEGTRNAATSKAEIEPDAKNGASEESRVRAGRSSALSTPPTRTKRDKNGRSHEDLLNDAPRVSGDVIDKEINERFNEEGAKKDTGSDDEGKVEVEVPDFDYVEELADNGADVNVASRGSSTTEAGVDSRKYPFYGNDKIPSSSALKYIVDPRSVPRKTGGGMEFYDSRDKYKRCEEVEPDLEKVLPDEEEPVPDRGPKENLPRLQGLGDKLDCFKAKYFDEDPFDNPLFSEKQVDSPTLPKELNPAEFSSRILHLPDEDHEQILQKLSRRPERPKRRKSRAPIRYEDQSVRVNYRPNPKSGRNGNAYLHRARGTRNSKNPRRVTDRQVKRRPTFVTTESASPKPSNTYQKQVYEDVMGNINNLVQKPASYQVYEVTTAEPASHSLVGAFTENSPKVSESSDLTRQQSVRASVDAKVRPSNSGNSNIRGLFPPPKSTLRNVGQPNKSRSRSQGRPNGYKVVGRYQTITIHKRSVGDLETVIATIPEKRSRAGQSSETDALSDLIAEESGRVSSRAGSKTSLATLNSESAKKVGDEQSDAAAATQKTVYTIRDRIRHSKPKREPERIGEFVKGETGPAESSRRKEPRYNQVRRRKSQTDFSTNSPSDVLQVSTASAFAWTSPVSKEDNEKTENSEPSSFSDATKTLEYSETKLVGETEDYPGTTMATTNTYAVRENVEEPVKTTTPSSNEEFPGLKKFLETNPPGYSEASAEDSSGGNIDGDGSKVADGFSRIVSKDEREGARSHEEDREDDDNDDDKSDDEIGSNEGSSEKIRDSDDSFKESSKESSKEDDESNEDNRTFFRYSSRPYSPPENYEDEKYSDLGPRVNKPGFYHPPFSHVDRLRDRGGVNSRRGRHFFPWDRDKDDDEDIKEESRSIGSYEYPWEKRARLARERERRKRKEDEYGRFKFSDDDDEDVSSIKRRRYVYPWDKYDVPSKRRWNTGKDYWYDSEEGSSDLRPVAKFNARYDSGKMKSLHDGEVVTSLPENGTQAVNEVSTNLLNDDVDIVTKESVPRSTPNRRRNSGMIVPEDITQAPRKRNLRRKQISGNVQEKSNVGSGMDVESVTANPRNKMRRQKTNNDTSTTNNGYKNSNRSSLIAHKEPTVGASILSSGRSRRRSKSSTTTSAPMAVLTTTSSSRIIRRRPQKSQEQKSRTSNNKSLNTTLLQSDEQGKTGSSKPMNRTIKSRSHSFTKTVISDANYPDEPKRTLNYSSIQREKLGNTDSENVEIERNDKVTVEGIKEPGYDKIKETSNVYGSKDDTLIYPQISKVESYQSSNEQQVNPSDGVTRDAEIKSDLPSENDLVGNVLRNATMSIMEGDQKVQGSGNNKENERTRVQGTINGTEQNERRIQFIKDPQRRLYYYVERRR